jgi:RNA polymerase sigma factor (sigma-70 family)
VLDRDVGLPPIEHKGRVATISSGMTGSDASVIAASLEDPTAFMAIFERHFAAVVLYLRRRLAPSTADDLASDVFATAFSRRHAYDVSWPDARPWLYGIAANHLRNYRRAEERALEAHFRYQPAGAAAGPLEQILSTSIEPETSRALLDLSPADREVLLLFAWADLSYEQIALALALPIGTVKSRLNRARSAVRCALVSRVPSPQEEASHG